MLRDALVDVTDIFGILDKRHFAGHSHLFSVKSDPPFHPRGKSELEILPREYNRTNKQNSLIAKVYTIIH